MNAGTDYRTRFEHARTVSIMNALDYPEEMVNCHRQAFGKEKSANSVPSAQALVSP